MLEARVVYLNCAPINVPLVFVSGFLLSLVAQATRKFLLVNKNEAQRLGRGRALFLRRFVFSLLAMELSPNVCRFLPCCRSSLTEVGACCGVSSASLLGSFRDVFVEIWTSQVFRVQGLRDLLTALATLPQAQSRKSD